MPSSGEPSPDFGPTSTWCECSDGATQRRQRTASLPKDPRLALHPVLTSPASSPNESQNQKHLCVLVIPQTFTLTILPGPSSSAHWLCCPLAARPLALARVPAHPETKSMARETQRPKGSGSPGTMSQGCSCAHAEWPWDSLPAPHR